MKKVLSILTSIMILFTFAVVPQAKFPVKADESYKWISVNVGIYGKEIYSFSIDPTNSQIIYACTDVGLYKSKDAGASWGAINNGITSSKVYALAIDLTNTQVLYAATENGAFKSTNGGKLWIPINNNLTNQPIYCIAIDPTNNQVVYAGTKAGVYKSTNGGMSWVVMNNGLTNVNINTETLRIDPTNSQIIYVGTDGGGVFKSTDGGNTWNAINNGITNLGNYKVLAIAIDPLNPQIIYASTGESWSGGSVFKSIDGGNTWTLMNSGLPNKSVNTIVIDPKDTQIVYVGNENGVFKSTNGGLSWGASNKGLPNYPDITAIAIDPANTQIVYAGNYDWQKSYVFKSTNGGTSWSYSSSSLTDQTLSSVVIDPKNPQIIYVGSKYGPGVYKLYYEDETLYLSSYVNWGLNETSVNCLAIDPKDTNTIYAGTLQSVYKSIDGGISWKYSSNGLTYYSSGIEIRSIAIVPSNTQILYAGTGVGLFKSLDGGNSWKKIGEKATAIAIDPTNTQVIYTAAGSIYKSKNGGASWEEIGKGLGGYFYSIAIDPTNPLTLYAGSGDHLWYKKGSIFKTTDGGATWNKISKDLGDIVVNTITIDQTNPQIIYVGTYGSGIFKSVDGGNTWTTLNSGLPSQDIYSIAIDQTNPNVIYAGTASGLAKYVRIFSIGATAGKGGTITPSGIITVNYGDSKIFNITPNPGYRISDVKVDGTSIGAVSMYTFDNITSNHTIEATFEPMTFTISVTSNIGGLVTPSGNVTVNGGDSKTFTITPNTGYRIKDVLVDGKSVGAVSTYAFTNITSNHTVSVTFEKQITETVIVLTVGSSTFTVNGNRRILDAPPIIKNGRTILPIRAVVEALGGTVGWDPAEKKVTISLAPTTIELWIGKNTAKVNGVSKPIDSSNPKVVPEVINGRTMVPLRFVTENLGCDVNWDQNTKTITITNRKG